MLVLTRKLGETIVIGENIRLTVLAIQGNKVRLGIDAPPDVRVDREEVALRIRELAEPQVVEAR
jgi:carbon storage regulator